MGRGEYENMKFDYETFSSYTRDSILERIEKKNPGAKILSVETLPQRANEEQEFRVWYIRKEMV